MVNKTIIFGAPGTGKTTTLINEVKSLMKKGYHIKDICFCAFTKKAAQEMRNRLSKEFHLDSKDMIYFRTIHSICYRKFADNKKVCSGEHLGEFFKLLNIKYKVEDFLDNEEDFIMSNKKILEPGNAIFDFYNHIRNRGCINLEEIKSNEELKLLYSKLNIQNNIYYEDIFLNGLNIYKILLEYEKYKKENDIIDFTDMLMFVYKDKWNVETKILMVDEFQDLNKLQYEIYKIWSKDKDKTFIAGDDDQCIFGFQGARSDFMLEEKKLMEENNDEVRILGITYRLPENILKHSLNFINRKIPSTRRVLKEINPSRAGGEIKKLNLEYDLSKLLDEIMPNKKNLFLFRTNKMINEFVDKILIPRGIVFFPSRGKGLWNDKTINLYNSIIKLHRKEPMHDLELQRLIEAIPSKTKLLKHGTKSRYKESIKKPSYTFVDLVEIGLNPEIDKITDITLLIGLMNIKDNQKSAFLNLKRELIEVNQNIEIGTIHANKGGEADNVILCMDITKFIEKQVMEDKENLYNEIRLFYVGMTRAKERLVEVRNVFEFSLDNDII